MAITGRPRQGHPEVVSITLHNELQRARQSGSARARAEWLQLFDSLNTGFSWDTICSLYEVAALASEFRRFLFLSTPLQDLVPLVSFIRQKLQSSAAESLFWRSFGSNNRNTHQYMINSTTLVESAI